MSLDEKEKQWLSSYQWITVQRILEKYRINLTESQIYTSLNNQNSFYNQLTKVPLKNLFNGIILQQIYDYQVFAQNLFVDYLISGDANADTEGNLSSAQQGLELERNNLITATEKYNNLELEHEKFTSESQAVFIKFAGNWNHVFRNCVGIIKDKSNDHKKAIDENFITTILNDIFTQQNIPDKDEINKLLLAANIEVSEEIISIFKEQINTLNSLITNLEEKILVFLKRNESLKEDLTELRSVFYHLIVRSQELLKGLNPYKSLPIDSDRYRLDFDKKLGIEK